MYTCICIQLDCVKITFSRTKEFDQALHANVSSLDCRSLLIWIKHAPPTTMPFGDISEHVRTHECSCSSIQCCSSSLTDVLISFLDVSTTVLVEDSCHLPSPREGVPAGRLSFRAGAWQPSCTTPCTCYSSFVYAGCLAQIIFELDEWRSLDERQSPSTDHGKHILC